MNMNSVLRCEVCSGVSGAHPRPCHAMVNVRQKKGNVRPLVMCVSVAESKRLSAQRLQSFTDHCVASLDFYIQAFQIREYGSVVANVK